MRNRRLLIYTEEFLSPSMTFIARQIETVGLHFDVSVMCQIRSNIDLFPYEPIHVIPSNGFQNLSERLRKFFGGRHWKFSGSRQGQIRETIKQVAPNLIHAHFGPSGLAILPIAKELGIPLVTTFHGFDASSYLDLKIYRQDLTNLFEYSEIVTVSEEMRLSLLELGADPGRTHCCYIGVPLEAFAIPKRRPLAEKLSSYDRIRFLQVSNFVEKKGHEYTVRAFEILLKQFPNCELLLVGMGPLKENIKDLVTQLGMNGNIQFLDHQDSERVASLMREADCFLHHSVTSDNGDKEGIPTVLMEAMATGLPVISTRHSGIPELVDDQNNGLLVNERDIKSYSCAMKKILNDKGEFGKQARVKIEQKYDISVCSQFLCKLFDSVL